ncbi:hypothetical protein FOPE_09548 [Fonsecaea pedrosoi]|nr:hypothetical protein FOPE_09548 [Fonsecaea pedrosoi]
MSEHPAFRTSQGYENPFVPVPPPPRRTAPNSRPGLTDGMIPGDDPFVKEIGKPSRSESISSTYSTHHVGGIAAGIAAAAAGAGLMHSYDHHPDENEPMVSPVPASDRTVPAQITRKPVPVHYANNSEPWPYSPVSPIDPVAENAGFMASPRKSGGESGPSLSRDPARANTVFDQDYAPHGGALGQDDHGLGAATGGSDAGPVGVAALGHWDNRDYHRSRSRSSSSKRHSRPSMALPSDGLKKGGRTSGDHGSSQAYKDVLPQKSYDGSLPGEHDPYRASATPPPRSRRNSAFGPAHPGAVAFNGANRPVVPSPLSSEVPRDPSYSPPRSRARGLSGSSSRFSFSYEPVADDYGAYPPFSITSSNFDRGKTGQDKTPTDQSTSDLTRPGVTSANEYVLTATSGPLGPQPHIETLPSSSGDRKAAMDTDDAPWRMSDGMPAGWQRTSTDSPRNSREHMRKRDSGVTMGTGAGLGGRRGRRLRASDIAGSSTARPGIDDDRYGYGYGYGYGQAL